MILFSLFVACSPQTASSPAPPAVVVEAPTPVVAHDAVAVTRARHAMQTLGKTLKGELKAKVRAGGPTAALEVCSSSAQSLTASVGRDLGVAVGRSSLRLRNPANAGPSWVKAWLDQQGERSAEGVEGEVSTSTDLHGDALVRVIAPLAIEAPCLICHGAESTRAPDLSATLHARFPSDQANGYAMGDLRGALWAEVPVVKTGLELELDGGQRWALDDSTRATMNQLRRALVTAPTDVAGAHAMAAAVDVAVSAMIEGCTMTGLSHDQLHAFLEVLFPAIGALKKVDDLRGAAAQREILMVLVVQFDAAFE